MSETARAELEQKVESAIKLKEWNKLTEQDLEKFLLDNFPQFRGDVVIGAKILKSFLEGAQHVSDRYATKNYPTHINDIPFALIDAPEESAAFQYAHTKKPTEALCFELSALEEMSSKDQEKEYLLKDLQGTVNWKGTMLEFARQCGIEEAHHAVFQKKKRSTSDGVGQDASQAEYDAQPNEFRALLWQLQDQEARGKTSTANITRQRIDAARKFRS